MSFGLYTTTLNFELFKEIGQEGRNSRVFLAHDKQLDGEIVIKQIPKSKMDHVDEYYTEAKKLYASFHNNVVGVNYSCEDSDNIYIAMPFYKNGSLKSLINSTNLSIREIIRYSLQFLSGLNHIHSKGLIHFDIKPDNILISDTNEAMLSDFGLSKAMDFDGYAENEFAYSKQVPPEMLTLNEFNLSYDIYLCGLTLYRLLNGNKHFDDQFFKAIKAGTYEQDILEGRFPNRDNFLLHVPLSLKRIVNKALEIEPANRYQNVLQLLNDLSSITENLDWRFREEGCTRSWELTKEVKMINIILTEVDATSFSLSTSRTNIESGKRTKINDYCRVLPKTGYRQIVQKALRDLQ